MAPVPRTLTCKRQSVPAVAFQVAGFIAYERKEGNNSTEPHGLAPSGTVRGTSSSAHHVTVMGPLLRKEVDFHRHARLLTKRLHR